MTHSEEKGILDWPDKPKRTRSLLEHTGRHVVPSLFSRDLQKDKVSCRDSVRNLLVAVIIGYSYALPCFFTSIPHVAYGNHEK